MPRRNLQQKIRECSLTRKVTDFFLYKAFKFAKTPRHLRHRCSYSGKQFIRIFGRSGIFLETSFRYFHGNRWTMDEKRIVHFLRGSLRSFRRRCLNGEFLTKEELSSCPGSRALHLGLGFPLANGLLLGSRSNQQIKTQS
jgi:hypothetical protein